MKTQKVLSVLLALALALGLAACSGTAAPDATPTPTPVVTEAPAEESHEHEHEHAEEAITSDYKEMLNRETDPIMQELYDTNDLATILEKHKCITVTITSYQADGSVSLVEVVEVTNAGDAGYDITATRTTSRGTAVGQGNSRDGYFVWLLADGTLQAQLSQPEEFLFMAQEEYLDSLFYADYSNVQSTEQNGERFISADMSYAGEAQNYKEYFWTDLSTGEITAMEERYEGPDGEMRNEYVVSYDQPYEEFPACDTLNQARNAADAADLSLVFVAPEFNYYSSVTYHLSASIAKNIDTDGYFKIFTSASFDPTTRVDNIVMDGDTTLYVLLLSYENAIKAMVQQAVTPDPTPEPTPTPAAPSPSASAAPSPTPAPMLSITKNPTDETVTAGGQAIFVAKADNATAITWLFAGSDNTIVLAKDAPNYFGCSVYGLGTTTITVANIPLSMNGWRIQCKFDGNGGPKWTSSARLTVNPYVPVPVPTAAPTPVPTQAPNLEAEAQALAWSSLNDITNRIQGYGWQAGTMQGFAYDSSVMRAQYDITASYSGFEITICCRAFPQERSYQPSSIYVYAPGGNQGFFNSYAGANGSQAWAAFTNDIAVITEQFKPAPAPIRDLSAEAQALAWDNLNEIGSRTRNYGWSTGTMQNFSYDSSVNTAQYDITASYNGLDITIGCRSYPLEGGYQPSHLSAVRGGNEVFFNSYVGASGAQAWAAFANDIAAVNERANPAPVPAAAMSGEFRGETGTALKLVVKWTAADNGNGTKQLTLDAYVEASTLHTASFPNGLCFKIGSEEVYRASNEVQDNSAPLAQTLLGSVTTTVNSTSTPVSVTWAFNGVYSNQEIRDVVASATLPLGG